MTGLSKRDRDLHHEDGSHRTTPVSTRGRALEQHERRLVVHLAHHPAIVDKTVEVLMHTYDETVCDEGLDRYEDNTCNHGRDVRWRWVEPQEQMLDHCDHEEAR